MIPSCLPATGHSSQKKKSAAVTSHKSQQGQARVSSQAHKVSHKSEQGQANKVKLTRSQPAALSHRCNVLPPHSFNVSIIKRQQCRFSAPRKCAERINPHLLGPVAPVNVPAVCALQGNGTSHGQRNLGTLSPRFIVGSKPNCLVPAAIPK